MPGRRYAVAARATAVMSQWVRKSRMPTFCTTLRPLPTTASLETGRGCAPRARRAGPCRGLAAVQGRGVAGRAVASLVGSPRIEAGLEGGARPLEDDQRRLVLARGGEAEVALPGVVHQRRGNGGASDPVGKGRPHRPPKEPGHHLRAGDVEARDRPAFLLLELPAAQHLLEQLLRDLARGLVLLVRLGGALLARSGGAPRARGRGRRLRSPWLWVALRRRQARSATAGRRRPVRRATDARFGCWPCACRRSSSYQGTPRGAGRSAAKQAGAAGDRDSPLPAPP